MRYGVVLCLLLIAAGPPKPIEPSPESVKLFGAKVQPVLMNSCASCHAGGRGGSFELKHVRPGVAAHPDSVQFNLASTLKYVNRAEPTKSPLLQRALATHGGMRTPAVKDANVPAYKHLEQWAKLVTAEPVKPQAPGQGPLPSGYRDEFDPAIFNNWKRD